jgi:hypothetical protein
LPLAQVASTTKRINAMKYTHRYTFAIEIESDDEYADRITNYEAYLAILRQAGTLYRVGTLPRALNHFDTEEQDQ